MNIYFIKEIKKKTTYFNKNKSAQLLYYNYLHNDNVTLSSAILLSIKCFKIFYGVGIFFSFL